ncbi:16S rRNA (cytosine(967)-C(5))-methyltransferase RsmB, partial [Achromobacter xylosoxidans]
MSTRSDSPNLAPPLSSVLLSSAEVVESVLDGRSLTDALADVESSLRPATQAVSFHAMRYLGWADAVGREMVQRYPSVLFESLLLVSLTLLKEEGDAAAALPGMPVYAAHTVVDQAVTAASRSRALASYKGMLNACLRRFLRERAALEAAVADSPEAQWN